MLEDFMECILEMNVYNIFYIDDHASNWEMRSWISLDIVNNHELLGTASREL
jgi:hypothetical protein